MELDRSLECPWHDNRTVCLPAQQRQILRLAQLLSDDANHGREHHRAGDDNNETRLQRQCGVPFCGCVLSGVHMSNYNGFCLELAGPTNNFGA